MLIAEKSEEQWREDERKTIESYRPLDDDFMRELFRNDLPLAQLVLRIITGIDDLELISEETQYDLKRLLGARSICLNVFGTDSKGRRFDLEIQRADRGATPQRARYHSSAIDVEFLRARAEFTELPISYVIFITENDVRGEGKPIYRFERVDTDTGTRLDDGAHIIFVNGAYDNPEDMSELAKLIHDFRCTKAEDMKIKELAEKTRYFKETPKGGSAMNPTLEKFKSDVAMLERIHIAMDFLNHGAMSKADIAKVMGFTMEEMDEVEERLLAKKAGQ
ncbi:MAG: Rpn family recombination-promoting nuclease/putative transposase [Bacteroides sp.]|nr:Rpn family recombination-promoting nuclease/putative transposase [Eubacterium sp.]MCM1419532.1 Rpn family recombination-promoting nuclease/putative transposase [Roseburia sp.]MCM1461539.1 Rpn family recombination-promoting nuclease/putative transposase [Bacteroides sp.]